jgi:hypothetical protein
VERFDDGLDSPPRHRRRPGRSAAGSAQIAVALNDPIVRRLKAAREVALAGI